MDFIFSWLSCISDLAYMIQGGLNTYTKGTAYKWGVSFSITKHPIDSPDLLMRVNLAWLMSVKVLRKQGLNSMNEIT